MALRSTERAVLPGAGCAASTASREPLVHLQRVPHHTVIYLTVIYFTVIYDCCSTVLFHYCLSISSIFFIVLLFNYFMLV
jgi:hypothetical protein